MNFISSATKSISQVGEKAVRSTTDMLAGVDNRLEQIIKRDDPIIISGVVWKRRGGLTAKLGSYENAWEKRYMELRGNVILYYECESNESNKTITGAETHLSSSPKEPRGYLDLVAEKAAISATYGHSGAPSPFAISIKVGLAQETKWKLCFDHHETQMDWLVKISDVCIKSSVDDYNQALLKATNPNNHAESSLLPRSPPVYEPGNGDGSVKSKRNSAVHTLWSLEDYTITNISYLNPEPEEEPKITPESPPAIEKAPLDNALHVMEKLLQSKEKSRSILEKNNNSLKVQVEELTKSIEEKDARLATFIKESLSREESLNSLKSEIEESMQDVGTETEALRDQVAELQKTIQDKDAEIEELSESREEIRVEMEDKIKILENDKSRAEKRQEKLLWALKEEFRQTLEAQKMELETLKAERTPPAASSSTGNVSDDDEFEDCVQ